MKTNPFLEYIMYDVFDEKDNIAVRAMMGGHILYKEGKVFALAEDDKFYLKGNKETESWYLKRGSKKFSYEKKGVSGKKKIQEMNFFLVPEEVLEDRDLFKEWMKQVDEVILN